ncbi:hypothetical protein Tco_0748089 [Tanacetum coccineum]|uniref:Uncharacterized protein n=1 Tax=Tanacetum coccineum TaxID=301880 RepID=A0ABQ4YY18_9ASTR
MMTMKDICKQVFKIKHKSTSEVDRFKARLVAKGFNQMEGSGIEFSKSDDTFKVIAFSDLDWAKCHMTKSAMASATCEVMWILKVLKDLNLDNLVTVTLFCDNKSTIHIAVNPIMHEKTKHFDIDVHLVREIVASSSIKAEKVDYKGLIADILTKALGSAQHTVLTKRLGMVNMFVS